MKRGPGVTTQVLLALGLAVVALSYSSQGRDTWAQVGAPAPALQCPSCDDLNPCTVDSCDTGTGDCVHDPVSDGTDCDDGSFCTTGDVCKSGACVGVPDVGARCDDGNPCTGRDTCTASGECLGEPALPGHPCDDSNACTSNDVCVATTTGGVECKGQAADCDDSDPCTTDTCDPSTGVCAHNPVTCDDGNPCTADSCDPATGACVRTPVGGPCEDGNACTEGDFCSNGNCHPGAGSPNCDDGNPCTSDSCDPSTGQCLHDLVSGPCDDGNPCTMGDACVEGSCSGTPVNCDDGNPCTADSCDATGVCQHAPVSGACDDGDACTTGDACSGGQCTGTPTHCDDGNVCTSDSCDPSTGACAHAPASGPCDDGDVCTVGESCSGGSCGGGSPRDCGASSECFANVCDPTAGCVLQPRIGEPCNGGNLCVSGVCNSTGCQVQTFLCDDQDVCTIDSCLDQATGACGHAPLSCDDGKDCTIDSCNSTTGCQHFFDAGLPDTDVDGLPDSCDNCPLAANRLQDDCNGNGIGDACDPSLFDLRIQTQTSFGKGSGVVIWSSVCEVDMRGFNVVIIDNQGGRTRLNTVPIPCTECVTGGSASYSTFIPKHKSARNIFLEVLHKTSATLTVGPAIRE